MYAKRYDYLNVRHLVGGKVFDLKYESGFYRVSCEGLAMPEFNRRTLSETKRAIELSDQGQV